MPASRDRLIAEPLSRRHDRAGFASGSGELDDYLRRRALQDQRKRIAVTHVLVDAAAPERILGYYTLSTYSVRFDALPVELARRLPRYPLVPAVLLGRLAVDRRWQGKRLGEWLLLDAMHRSLTRLAPEVAVYAMVVHAKDERAAAFYERYDFRPFPSRPLELFLPMGTVVRLFTP